MKQFGLKVLTCIFICAADEQEQQGFLHISVSEDFRSDRLKNGLEKEI